VQEEGTTWVQRMPSQVQALTLAHQLALAYAPCRVVLHGQQGETELEVAYGEELASR
jgi:hypothetical protein